MNHKDINSYYWYDVTKLPDGPIRLTITVAIKNRTRFSVKHQGKQMELALFKRNVQALFKLHRSGEPWELLVVDFKSTDVSMDRFLKEEFSQAQPGFSYRVISQEGPFNLGKGRNLGLKEARYPYILFLDADMLLTSRELIRAGQRFNDKGKAFFPVCLNYCDPAHSQIKVRKTGTGIVMLHKAIAIKHRLKWTTPPKWGGEDLVFFQSCVQPKAAARSIVPTLFHQWHPTSQDWKNRYTLIGVHRQPQRKQQKK